MAKQIKRSDIVEDDVFKTVRESAESTLKKLQELNTAMKQSAKILKEEMKSANTESTKSINELVSATEKANKLKTDSIKVDQEEIKLQQQIAKLKQEEEKRKQQVLKTDQQQLRTAQAQQKEKERQIKAQERAAKTARDEASAYKQLERNTRELKNQSKELGAQMLVLEKSGRKNSAEYRKLAQQYRDTTKAAQQGDAQLKKLDKTVGDNFRNVGNYQSAVGGLKNMLGQLGIAFGIGTIVRSAFNAVKDFDQGMANLASVLGKTRDQIIPLEEDAKRLGATTRFTAGEVAGLQTEFAKLGFNENEILNATESTLALAGATGTDLARAAEVSGSTLRAFGLDASEMQRVNDVMAKSFSTSALDMEKFAESMKYVAPVAKAAGLSIEETTAMIGKLADNGIKGSSAGTALRRIISEMAKTGKPTAEAIKQLAGEGLTLTDAMDEVGRSAQTALLVLSENMEGVDKLTTTYENAEGAAQQMADTQLNTVGGSLALLQSAWEGYILKLNDSTKAGSNFAKAIKFLADNLEFILDSILEIVKVYAIWKAVTLSQIALNRLLGKTGEGALTSLKNGFSKLGAALKANAITLIITGIIYAISKLKGMIDEVNAPFEVLNGLNEKLGEVSQRASDKLGEEQANLKVLVGTIKAHNAGSKERGELLKQLNDKYGVHLQNIKDETEANRQLDVAQRQIIANLKSQIQLEARQEQYVEVVKATVQAEDAYLKKLDEARKYYAKRSDKQINQQVEVLIKATAKTSPKTSEMMKQFNIAERRQMLIEQYVAIAKQPYDELLKKQEEYETKLQDQMNKSVKSVNQGTVAINDNTGATDKNSKSKAKLKTEIDAINESLTKQNELLAKIDEIVAKNKLAQMEKDIEIALANAVALAKETGEIFTGEQGTPDQFGEQLTEIEQLIEARYEFEIQAVKNAQAEKLSLIEQGYIEESRKEREALEEKYQELLKQENLTVKAKAEIQKSYEAQLEQIRMNDLQRNADFELEKIILTDETNQKLIALEKEKNAEINNANDKLIDAQTEYWDKRNEQATTNLKTEEELEKDSAQRRMDIIQAITDLAIEQSQKRVQAIEEEMKAAESQADYYRKLAEEGNITAKESLAEQNRLLAEATKKKEQELKKQERIQFANTVYQTYQKNASDDSVKNPLAKTITDVTLLTQFIKTFPAFLEGTEDTGTNGKGVDGKGGFHAILHPNERVMTKEQNMMVGDLSNEALAKIAMDYNTGQLISKGSGAIQLGSGWNSMEVVKKLSEIEATIKNKPETNIELGEIIDGAMTIVKDTKKGNSIIHNRYRVKR